MKLISFGSRPGLASALGILLVAQPLFPAVITVGGGCSLADAITAANTDSATGGCAAGSGADELRLTADVDLLTALPVIANGSTVTIRGNGFRVQRDAGAPDFRIFEVPTSGDLTLDNIEVSGGAASKGAGVDNAGVLTVIDSAITGNAVSGFGGGGGISTIGSGSLTLVGSTVSGNSAFNGGGIQVFSGTVLVSESHVDGNQATARGGGIYQYGGSLNVLSSTISGNTVSGGAGAPGHYGGGGVFLYTSGTIVDSTISGNSIGVGNGGGILNYYGGVYGPPVTITNSTVTGNAATNGTAIYSYIAVTNLANSAITGTCTGYAAPVDGGNNFGCGFGSPPELDPVLADNGGPTPTHALLLTSPAIDAAGSCGSAVDQRGFERSGDCDSGAFEFEGVRPAVGGSSGGVQTFRALCLNRNTSARVTIGLGGSSAWDCEGAGLVVGAGDIVEQALFGRALSATIPITGSVSGMRLESVVCRNLTSGTSAMIVPAGLGSSWDCTAAGLVAAPNDRLRIGVRGSGD